MSIEHQPSREAGAVGSQSSAATLQATGRQRWSARDYAILMGCNLIVLVSNICIMVLELTASRLIAKHVGRSLYTWTSVIGVVLAGITIGNYLGGWLADRVQPKRMLGWLFLIASLLSISVLWLDQWATTLDRPHSLDWPTWVLALVAGMFLLPSIALGTISPVVAALALSRITGTGITVGNVYAWGALGSIVGTFLSGFFLIDLFGAKAIIGLTAGTLALMGVFAGGGQRVFRTAVLLLWLPLIGLLTLAASTNVSFWEDLGESAGQWLPGINRVERDGWPQFGADVGRRLRRLGTTLQLRDEDRYLYRDESNYSHIAVAPSTEHGENVKYLKLDSLIHSYCNPQNPKELHYTYEQVYAAVTEQVITRRHEESHRLGTLFLGGGGFAFPRWVEATYPNSRRIDVAELDPAVKKAARAELGLPPDDETLIDTYLGDARRFVDERLQKNAADDESPVRYDFIYGDAFNNFSVPWHLTTREFSRKIKRLLRPQGVYLVNIIDMYPRTVAFGGGAAGEIMLPPNLVGQLQDDWPSIPRVAPQPDLGPIQPPVPKQWTGCREPFAALELKPLGDGKYRLGVRGAMSPKLRARLLELAGSNSKLAAAVKDLFRRSAKRQEGRFLASYVNTLNQVFANLYVFSSAVGRPDTYRETFVVAASKRPLNLEEIGTKPEYWTGSPFASLETDGETGETKIGGQMRELLQLADGLVLTDDYAPVDNLLAPVFVSQD